STPRGSTCWPGCRNAGAAECRRLSGRTPCPHPQHRAAARLLLLRTADLLPFSLSPVPVLFIEPDVLSAIAVEDAIDHECQPFDRGLPTRSTAGIKDDRPGCIFGQFPLDCPKQLLASPCVGLGRLLLDQPIHFGAAITVPV